jgi:Fibronectin type III domain
VPALIFGVLLFILGGAAGAVVRGTTTGQGTQTVVVHAKPISKSDKPHTRFPLQPGSHPPTVTTGGTSAVSQTAATLAASVNPNGGEVSECKLEYGTSSSYDSSASCSPSPGSASSPVAVSASITGLAAKTTYRYRITATNPAGTSKDRDQTFTTLPNAPTIAPPSAPTEVTAKEGPSQASVSWSAPSSTGGNKITSYTVTPYAGESAKPPVEVAPTETSMIVKGLTNGTSYTFTVAATNAVGAGPASEHSNAVTPHATIY